MNNSNLPPQLTTPNDPRSISEADTSSTCSWDSEISSQDSDDGAMDSLAHEGCADDAYWEEETSANAWLARFPGGTSLLYPQLFVVKPRGGIVLTPSRYPSNDSFLLHLPAEIRNRIYAYYFHRYEEVKHPEETYAPFRDREGVEMPRMCLSSSYVELKFWLSTTLLQTSRQLRLEAMLVFFSNRVITVEWLPVLPRLVEFLGKEGCAMVRYLDIWDSLSLQTDNKTIYRNIITSIMHFSGLCHLRIVVSGSLRNDRTAISMFDRNEWKQDGTLMEEAVPKLRPENIERHYPEHKVLKNLKAQAFTFALETPADGRYREFDRSHGTYLEISQSMQSHAAPSLASLATSSSPQTLGAFEGIEIQLRSRALTRSTKSDEEDSQSPTWQETDNLVNKTIPIYNFLREFFYKKPVRLPQGNVLLDTFHAFPTARKSTGSIMQDCALCYLSEWHCGYHSVPDQPPFETLVFSEEDVKTLQARFEDLSYLDMRAVCQEVVHWMKSNHSIDITLIWNADPTVLMNIAAIFDYIGWPETPASQRLARLDAAVETGWVGKRVDKDEVPPWDMLYREVYSGYSYHCRFFGEASNS